MRSEYLFKSCCGEIAAYFSVGITASSINLLLLTDVVDLLLGFILLYGVFSNLKSLNQRSCFCLGMVSASHNSIRC
jgi:hypothetical protein